MALRLSRLRDDSPRRSAPLACHRVEFGIALLATLGLSLALRLWHLDRVPGELYGDIAIVYEYVAAILAGRWPTSFVLSAGPLYHYAIIPLVWIFGLSYFSLKVASVAVSLAVLAVLYALGRELLDRELGLLSLFIGGVSSWLLIFSRLGNSQILVPLLATGALLFAARLAHSGRDAELVACAVVSTLGLYVYPQAFVLAPVMFVTLLCLVYTRTAVRGRHLSLFIPVVLACAVPFVGIVGQNPANFFTGYIGGKLQPASSLMPVLAGNVVRALLAFHVRGDVVFRSNPFSLPHLDWISGLLFLGGAIFWLRPGYRRFAPLLFVPFFLLQTPSILVLRYPDEVPSASRTLGVAPIAYLLAASGLRWLGTPLQRFRPLDLLVAAGILAGILRLNVTRYFDFYVAGLPDQNIPSGRVIAEYVDQLPAGTHVYLVGCCWGEGQPEPKSVLYVTHRPEVLHFVDPRNVTCSLFERAPKPLVVIWRPESPLPADGLDACAPMFNGDIHRVGDVPIFRSAALGLVP